MRAVRYHEAGGPACLRIDEIERPTPADDEILVEIHAASINPTDVRRREEGTGLLPKTSGSDFSGVVADTGQAVTGFVPGDRICGTGLHTTRFQQGSFADYALVPIDIVTHLPDDVTFEEAAAVALVGVTAWQGLIVHGGLEPTDRCLIHGGTGGVGHVAVQLSDRLCAHTVTTANPARKEAARAFGADAVLNYANENLLQALFDQAETGYDVIFDHRAHEYFGLDIESAAFLGDIVLYGGQTADVNLSMTAIVNNISFHAMTMSNLVNSKDLPSVASVLRRIVELVSDGELRARIDRTYGLEEAEKAHRALESESFVGKIVVTP